MSDTPTPRTDEAWQKWLKFGNSEYLKDASLKLETELTAANARIAELEKESRDVPLCADHAEAWFCHRNFQPGDCWFCELSNQILSLTRQLSEAQTQLASEGAELKKLRGYYSEIVECLGHDLVIGEINKLHTQLASAREDAERLDWLRDHSITVAEKLYEIGWSSPTDAQWTKLAALLHDIRSVVDAARGVTSPPASAEPGPASMWQPIETAPKGRTSILVHCAERRNSYVVYWKTSDNPRDMQGWMIFGAFETPLIEEPTHWQPLPAPPTQDGKEQGK